jgi:hypothetical protein
MTGTPRDIADTLRDYRDRHGITYITVLEPFDDYIAKAIAKLLSGHAQTCRAHATTARRSTEPRRCPVKGTPVRPEDHRRHHDAVWDDAPSERFVVLTKSERPPRVVSAA